MVLAADAGWNTKITPTVAGSVSEIIAATPNASRL